jgi:lactate 2-monooxygenase
MSSGQNAQLPRQNYGGFGNERQGEIYLLGQKGIKPTVPIAYEELVEACRSILPQETFDYIHGGAGSEQTISENDSAFSKWALVPRVLTKVKQRDTTTEIFGQRIPAPIFLAPIGAMSLVCSGAELHAARAADSLGLPIILSTLSSHSIEEVASAAPRSTKWFQLYFGKDPEVNTSLVGRAEKAGYSAIVVTPDTRMLAWRVRDMKNAFLPFLGGVGLANYTTDPAFMSKTGSLRREEIAERAVRNIFDQDFDWDDVSDIKKHTGLPIVVKGILDPRDAKIALDAGVDGLIVSNHGGRQIDGSISSLEALPSVVKAVEGKMPVLFDSGIRSGSHIAKALALGADAVLLGRPYIWGLTIGQETGTKEILENIIADFDLTLGLLGCSEIAELTVGLLKERN